MTGLTRQRAAEAVAALFGTSARQTQVCNAWKDSPDHYANIISPDFTTMGVACWFCDTADGQYTYWTVTFG